jgi:cysteine desulfurase
LIYLDHHATTPVDARVLEAMLPFFSEDFGNPASRSHRYGWRAEGAIEAARESVAAAVGAKDPREIVFTSGATESDNLALKGALRAGRPRAGGGAHVITVATEHPAVLDPCAALEREGFAATVLPVDGGGFVDPDRVADAIGERTVLVSVMAANSEIGTLQPLAAIGEICAERDVLFHTDAAQALGKIPLDVEDIGVDLLSGSAHKVYGPKGVGFLYVRRRRRSGPRIRLEPLLHGGGHEQGLRSGTLPVPLCVGLGRALAIGGAEREAEAARLTGLRSRLLARLRENVPGIALNGPETRRLPGNLNLAFEGIDADALIAGLDEIALSTGSACSSASAEPSHVLKALGLPKERVAASVRIGLGRGTTEAEVDLAADRIAEEVAGLRAARQAVASPGAGR